MIGGGGENYVTPQYMLLKHANRHGLIAGATGTGKTVTLQILAEALSAEGVPVFLTDVKGDLGGLAMAGSADADTDAPFKERAQKIGYSDYAYRDCPVTFWDVFGQTGHPVRATITEMGPLLLSRLLELSEPQEGVLNVAFRIADDEGLPLLDLKDLQSLLAWLGEHRTEVSHRYGAVSTASIGAIQRRLLMLENDGAAQFFGEPALELVDLMRIDDEGRGFVNILSSDKLMGSPRLYATVLLWLLSELFETLPEVGDPDKPKLVLFFDEAHLLFDGAPKTLMDKLEQVARLIRSKGVGVYFVTQNPSDVPKDILGQLGNRIQHALRAFTAQDRKALKAAAETYRDNPRLDLETCLREVGTGEAVTSMLEKKGVPGMAERTLICPPRSQLGPIPDETRKSILAASAMAGKYDTAVDRESAFEMLKARADAAAKEAGKTETRLDESDPSDREFSQARRYNGTRVGRSTKARSRSSRSDSVTEAFAKSFARQLGTQSGRAIVRGVLGGLFKGR
ncbi:helicase HerA-like domain-containing protein [Qingshengfaniella alkalisoli]